MLYLNKLIYPIFGLLLCIFISSCNEDVEPDVKSSDITKQQREQLGDRIQLALAINEDLFPVVPPIPPYDTTLYWYVQELYNQATFQIHQDRESPDDDQWEVDRFWQVTILDQEEANAFIIPGGHFYVTTGLLKQLKTEHELYYIMAFEAILMNNRLLLNRLVTQYSPTLLVDFSNGAIAPNGTTGEDLAFVISNLPFEEEDVLEVDNGVAPLICNSSLFARDGILTIMAQIQDSEQWFTNRPSYTGRAAYIVNEVIESGEDCQSNNRIRTNGGYRRYVLDRL